MHIEQNVKLTNYSTMRLGGLAQHLCIVKTRSEILEAIDWASAHQLPIRMIGTGSNIIWRDEGFAGLIIVNHLKGRALKLEGEFSYLTVGAGEIWDDVVEYTVRAKLSGIEALSLIPGTCGATPIQNVGAYGQEISQTLHNLEAYDQISSTLVTIPAADCQFGYRTSRFKTTDQGRFLITSLTFRLHNQTLAHAPYPAVQAYFESHNITEISPATIRQAVIAIRSQKLPDPSVIGNSGSFFANPVVSVSQFTELQKQYGELPHWQVDGGVKLAGAWLIEQAGFKDYHDTVSGMATWGSQPLVLVNEAATSTANLLAFRDKIVAGVAATFNIHLEQEPELLP